jgi:hypothetical protein
MKKRKTYDECSTISEWMDNMKWWQDVHSDGMHPSIQGLIAAMIFIVIACLLIRFY